MFTSFWVTLLFKSAITAASSSFDEWTVVDGVWMIDRANDYFVSQYATQASAAVLANKQWYNADGIVTVNASFSVNVWNRTSDYWVWSGLSIFNGLSRSQCQYYWIGIEASSDLQDAYIAVGRGDYLHPTDTTYVEITAAPISVQENVLHSMSVTITAENLFTVHWNGVKYIDIVDLNGYKIVQNGYSGYIGLESSGFRIVTVQSVSVSGTETTTDAILDELQCSIPITTAAAITTSTGIATTATNTDSVVDDESVSSEQKSNDKLDTIALYGMIAVVVVCAILVVAFSFHQYRSYQIKKKEIEKDRKPMHGKEDRPISLYEIDHNMNEMPAEGFEMGDAQDMDPVTAP